MSEALLKISRLSEVAISVESGALALKAETLQSAAMVLKVSGEMDQLLCVEVVREIKHLRKMCEDSRVMVKAPVLKLGRDVDAKAFEYDTDLGIEEARLQKLLDGFAAEQKRIADEAERKRREEIERVERERREAEEKARREAQAELARIEREKQAALSVAKSEQDRVIAAQQAEVQRQNAILQANADAERARIESEKKAVAASSIAVLVPVKADGLSVSDVWKFEVLNPAEVYKAHPEFCDVTVRPSLVNAAMKRGLRECPGLRIWKETHANVRKAA